MDPLIKDIRSIIRGEVILPEDDNFDDARKIYNGMIDKKPAIILKCIDADDVIAGVNYARENQMELAVKSGGHNGAGLSLVDNGLVIDLSAMKAIQINAGESTGKIEPGNTLAEIDKVTHEYGLALPSV